MKTVIAIIAALMLTLGTASIATAAPATPEAGSSATTPAALPPGDTPELRTGIGAGIGVILGGLAGAPFFIIGAIPGAIIGGLAGAAIGNASWNIANTYSNY